MSEALLVIEDLVVDFATEQGTVRAVDGVSLCVEPGEILGVVGESGSGKSVTARSVLGLGNGAVSGKILLDGEDLRTVSARRLREVRGSAMAMIFQDPMTALNPVMTIGAQIREALWLHDPESATRDRVLELLTSVGIPDPASRHRQYPHEFSGGMRQRAMIAIALANRPRLLIADEPTTALDVTIQAQVLELLRNLAGHPHPVGLAGRQEPHTARLQPASATATMLITHDLGVVAELADRVVVMYAGKVVEEAEVRALFRAPRHPYTSGLLASLPDIDAPEQAPKPIAGTPPDGTERPSGCAFHPRCPLARDKCREVEPELRDIGGRKTACHFFAEVEEL